MIIRDSQFIISAVSLKQCPPGQEPEVTLSGRSNVGKSSLINRLLNRRNLARISSSPGKTQTLNFYHVNENFYFVDLPGYGYAKVAKSLQQQWGPMIESYLMERDNLRLILHLVDIRHEPSKEDKIMTEFLRGIGRPFAVVATKADKISRGALTRQVAMLRKSLQLSAEDRLFATSAETGLGIDELWNFIEQATL